MLYYQYVILTILHSQSRIKTCKSGTNLAQIFEIILFKRCKMGQDKSQKQEWVRLEAGIRCRQHPTRKHGIRPDTYFVLRFTVDGKTHQEALGWASEGVTLAKARVELARLKEAKRTGEGARSLRERRELEDKKRKEKELADEKAKNVSITVSQYWNEAYWPSQIHKAKGSLVAEMALWTKWIAPVIGDIPISSLTPAVLEPIKIKMLAENKAPSSIKYALAVVSQLWNFAQKNNIVEGISPTKKISLPKKDNKRQRYLSREEADKLLIALEKISPKIHQIAVFGLECGLRFGEIASLCWEDCDFERGQILIRDPKARSNRFAFMTPKIRNILESMNVSGTGLIFPDSNGNKRDRIPKQFRQITNEMFNKNITDARLRVCFHTLRHTFASWLVEGGVSLYEVKELMGHSDFKMTQRYSHLSPEGLKNAIQIIGKYNGK